LLSFAGRPSALSGCGLLVVIAVIECCLSKNGRMETPARRSLSMREPLLGSAYAPCEPGQVLKRRANQG
jgi:hypothetical protein